MTMQTHTPSSVDVLDGVTAGYLLDLVSQFGERFPWRFDEEVVQSLLCLASRNLSGRSVGPSQSLQCASSLSLLRRLQLAGHIVQGERGFALTGLGERRRSTVFRALLSATPWLRALESVQEDLKRLCETEGLPLLREQS